MRSMHRQRGLGMWGWIFVLGVIGFFSLVTLQLVPIYLSELSIQKVVRAASKDPSLDGAAPQDIRRALQTRWDVEGITTLEPKDIKVTQTTQGRLIGYDYEAQAPLFYNISIVVHFQNQYKMGGGSVE